MIKTFPAELVTIVRGRRGRQNLRALARFCLVLAGMILTYTVVFHLLMLREGQYHSWITGFYWTLTVMSTLGFGDITFHTDLGRIFSIIVLMSGMIFLLVLLPFTFIEFFYAPWISAQATMRARRELSPETRGHVLLTNYDAIVEATVRRLQQRSYPYAVVCTDIDEGLRLHDLGVSVIVGELDDPNTWSRARVESSALVAGTATDVTNAAVALTVRQLAADVVIITTASDEASVDILKLAGADYVLRSEEAIGQSFARRTVGGDAKSHVIGSFGELFIAEASAHRTPLVGRTLLENKLREKVGASVVGVWERGRFEPARAETVVTDNMVLVLAGTQQQLSAYDSLFSIYNVSTVPVVILGGGRVGRATARALEERGLDYRIVELLPERVRDPEKYVVGSAAELSLLEKAGIRETPSVIITPHEDDLNVYLTLYCRQLRPDVQILSRATYERNVATLHRAGADSVLSYATMGASRILNLLDRGRLLTVAEGLDLFEVPVPAALVGKTIAASTVRERTGCSIVAIRNEEGMQVVPSPDMVLPGACDMILIGTVDAEAAFLNTYPEARTAA